MPARVLLCPVDFSAATASLVGCADRLARATGAALHLLHVAAINGWITPAQAVEHREAQHLLDAYGLSARQAGLRKVSTVVCTGEAAAEIVAYATHCQVTGIILGAYGCACLTRFLMGSTAEQMLRRAPCTVLLLRAYNS